MDLHADAKELNKHGETSVSVDIDANVSEPDEKEKRRIADDSGEV